MVFFLGISTAAEAGAGAGAVAEAGAGAGAVAGAVAEAEALAKSRTGTVAYSRHTGTSLIDFSASGVVLKISIASVKMT